MAASAASPAGAPMQSWLEKWSEWEIQAVVLVSFGLQVILFFFAGMRRYSISSFLKVFLWLVYLSADAAAIYALGHMSASLSKISSDRHQLVAFWAPFLLLHLGGQDTITAYALEENKLWRRHLLNMSVQVAVTGYVLHKYIIADSETIVSAAVLIAVAGFVKYGERIWALKWASKGSNLPSACYETISPTKNCFTRNENVRTYEFIARIAQEYRYFFVKSLIIDRNVDLARWGGTVIRGITGHVDTVLDQGNVSAPLEKRYAEEVYTIIEVQLGLAYDMLYTKARVIHTGHGYLIRGISFGFCFGALVSFTRSNRDGYNTPDIVITFVLLGGACALEVASAFKVIGSTWIYEMLDRCNLNWLFGAIMFARYHLIVVKDGRWSNSVGRYDFLSLCAGKTKLKGRMAGCIGLKDWWNKAHYTKHVKLSPAVKEFVWGLLRGEKSGMVQIEDVAIRNGYWARRLTGFDHCEEIDWSLRLEFRNCVLIWHIATSAFLGKSELVGTGMAEAVNTLSDYMMYLLVQHPDILPVNAAACNLFEKTYDHFRIGWSLYPKNHIKDGIVDVPQQRIRDFINECNPPSTITLYHDPTSDYRYAQPGLGELMKASILVRQLLNMKLELTHKLVIIGRVWMEMLCYAATNAPGDFHARQLSNGGEFLTHILMLTIYCPAMPPIVQDGYRAADDQPDDADVPVEPTVEAAGHVKLDVNTDGEKEITESR